VTDVLAGGGKGGWLKQRATCQQRETVFIFICIETAPRRQNPSGAILQD